MARPAAQISREYIDRLKAEAARDPVRAYTLAGFVGEVRRDGGTRWKGLCPFHDEKTASFTLFSDGGFHCFGCVAQGDIIDFYQRVHGPVHFNDAIEELGRSMGITMSATEKQAPLEPREPYTVEMYADYVSLPAPTLEEWGVRNGSRGDLLIFYYDESGGLLRARVRNGESRLWGTPDTAGEGSYLYGRDRLTGATDPIIIVEGESDCHVLWYNSFSAVGAPGQKNFKPPWVGHLPACERVFVLREPRGCLPETVLAAVQESGRPEAPEVLEFTLSAGDALDLWHEVDHDQSTFRQSMEAALQCAGPVTASAGECEEDFLKKSVAAQLLEITLENADPLFLTPEDEAFVRVPVAEHFEIIRLNDGRFREWVEEILYSRAGRAAHSNGLSSARAILGGRARVDSNIHTLHNRVAWHDADIWYDLTDRDWRAVRIYSGGWEIVDHPPVLFRRNSHHVPQVTPERGGNAERLLDFVNVNGDDRLLLLVYALGCLVPNIPHPVLILTGSHGSAKTTAASIVRRLVDPSTLDVLTFPRSEKELVQQLHHHWFAVFDNVTSLPEWLSDALCRASTGGGFAKRRLYTDDEDVIFKFKRCVGLTAVTSPVIQPDLLDRCVIINVERIANDARRLEQDVWDEFHSELPGILGGAFDALGEAVRVRPTLRFDGLPRMADFAAWGAAIAIGLGRSKEEWMEVYERAIDERHLDAMEANPFASAVLTMMSGRTTWKGTASELLEEARSAAEMDGIDTSPGAWPGSARSASDRLYEAEVDLKQSGISVSRRRTGARRILQLHRQSSPLQLLNSPGSEGTA